MIAVSLPPAISGPYARALAAASRFVGTMRWEASHIGGPIVRRAVDVALASSAMIASGPVVLAAAAAIKTTSPGPVFYRQVRVGLHGAPFGLYKLRTMYIDAEARLAALVDQNESVGGVTFKIRNDPRVTPVGRILRKFSIDELPQLWNVLSGSMTVFGPRPPIPSEVAKYGPRERRRLEVKPGLTCLWQVSGRSDLSFEQQVALDLEYIDKSTPGEEARILARTIPAVISGKGAY